MIARVSGSFDKISSRLSSALPFGEPHVVYPTHVIIAREPSLEH